MRLRTGTSGFSYKEWKGSFYPTELPNDDMLSFYAQRLSTVEINNTFYRMPREPMLDKWCRQVPKDFVFVLKASRKITHLARLKESAYDAVDYLWKVAAALGAHLGPFLFQLPPNMKKDVDRLATFLGALPAGLRAAFEFRNDSWLEDDVYELLHDGGHALCVTDPEAGREPHVVSTASWGYVRLRAESYDERELRAWRRAIQAQRWQEAFVFFKHDESGVAPRLAQQLASLC